MTATARPVGPPGYSETLPCTAASVARSRILARAALAAWGLPELVEPGALVASELVSNAVRHVGRLHLRVTVSRPEVALVRIAVVDRSVRPPVLRLPDADDEGGRGLLLVDATAARWGVDPLPWGKRVWAELAATAPG
ncbi:ATP-binding protein [Streptomyces chumphonensis]|uniref:ATP-binding protein n=1 Tax=Streptomyces chumphonensis TaxID=1214925 RepID=UPI003D765302